MTRLTLSRLFGGATALIGCWWIGTLWIPSWTRYLDPAKESPGLLFILILLPLMTVPGALAAYFGYRLAREPQRRHIMGSAVAVAIFGVMWIAVCVEPLLPVPESIGNSLSFLIATIIIIPLYMIVCNVMVVQSQRPPNGVVGFIGKATAFIIALQVWSVSFETLDVYAPVKEGYAPIKEMPWGIATIAGPLVLGWTSYKTLAWLFELRKVEPRVQPDRVDAAG